MLKWLTRLFFPQDHRNHECRISDHDILLFDPWHSSNSLHGSERHTDECYGHSSIQEYDTIYCYQRHRVFYHPVSWHLKYNLLCGKEQAGDAIFTFGLKKEGKKQKVLEIFPETSQTVLKLSDSCLFAPDKYFEVPRLLLRATSST